MFHLGKIIGKKVICIKGVRTDRRTSVKYITPVYILFDDGETYIELEEQDYYAYHDCSYSARQIEVTVNETRWKNIMDDNDYYPPAATDI